MVEIDQKTTDFSDLEDIKISPARRVTSVSLSDEDFLFVKQHGLMFSQILHDRIKELQDIKDGTIITDRQDLEKVMDSLSKKVEIWQTRYQRVINFLNDKDLIDSYLEVNKDG